MNADEFGTLGTPSRKTSPHMCGCACAYAPAHALRVGFRTPSQASHFHRRSSPFMRRDGSIVRHEVLSRRFDSTFWCIRSRALAREIERTLAPMDDRFLRHEPPLRHELQRAMNCTSAAKFTAVHRRSSKTLTNFCAKSSRTRFASKLSLNDLAQKSALEFFGGQQRKPRATTTRPRCKARVENRATLHLVCTAMKCLEKPAKPVFIRLWSARARATVVPMAVKKVEGAKNKSS